MTDAELHLQLKKNDKKAFNQLFQEHYTPLTRYAIKIIGDAGAAEELVQDVFVSVWKNRHKSEIQSFKAYLTRAVKNKCINYIKSNYHDHQPIETAMHVTKSARADDELSEMELRAVLANAEKTLPQQTGLVFALSRHSDMTYGEIANELGITTKTVEYHISKAFKLLRSFIEAHGFLLSMVVHHFLITNFDVF